MAPIDPFRPVELLLGGNGQLRIGQQELSWNDGGNWPYVPTITMMGLIYGIAYIRRAYRID
jgi:membrane protease YdiL (CAAX protease family)